MTTSRVGVSLTEALDDLYSIFPEMKSGHVLDTDVEEDPDEDLEDPTEEVVVQDDEESLKDLNPITTLYMLKDKFGDDWWELDHDALVDTLTQGAGLPDSDRDLISSLQLLYADEPFWTEWEVFNWVTQGLTDNPVDFSTLGVLDVLDIMASMSIAEIISKDQQADARYSQEVLSYIAVTCLEAGVWALPTPMSVAQKRVNELLSMRGWPPPPVDRVHELAQGDKRLPPTSDINVQARRYRALTEFRDELLRTATTEFSEYEKVKDAGNL